MNTKIRCPSPSQRFIIAECKQRGLTRADLARLSGISIKHIYDYLVRPTSHLHIDAMLAALGATFVVVGKTKIRVRPR